MEKHGRRGHVEQVASCPGGPRPARPRRPAGAAGQAPDPRPRGAVEVVGFPRRRIVVTLVDPRSGSKGKASSTIYVAVSLMGRDNLFRSADSGKTWQPVPGQPTQYRPTHMVMASDGTLFLSYGVRPDPAARPTAACGSSIPSPAAGPISRP